MAWIKRNLYFVITVVVGLGLTGYCGYLLYSAMSDNAAASDQYTTAQSSLDAMLKKVPFPSKENIEAAEADMVRVTNFLAEFRKPFSGFPIPPKVDDRQFKDILQRSIFQFGEEATNAGVSLIPGYTFAFAQQIDKLIFPPEYIAPWMQELEEIKALLHIFYKAKINYLEMIKRPAAGPDDGGSDINIFPISPKPWGVVSPYMINFRAFSAEIANVLAGIASSSNCFIVEGIYVSPSKVPIDFNDTQPEPAPVVPQYRPPSREANQFMEQGGMRGERGEYERRRRQAQPLPSAASEASAAPAASSKPVTFLRETPLFVTIYIDVVKLKAAAPPAPAAKPRTTMQR